MSSNKLSRFASIAMAFVVSIAFTQLAGADQHAQRVYEAFAKKIADNGELTDAQKTKFKTLLETSADDPQYAITDVLVAMYPNFSDAIDVSDASSADEAIASLQPITESKDRYLAADASFVLARTLMNVERFEEAMPLLEDLVGDLGQFSANRSVAQYYIGVAQAGLLNNQAAINSFMKFLQANHQDAPERLVVSAWRQVQQLQSIKAGQLDDVYQRMDYSRRRLQLVETDEATQDQQNKIVTMLTKLIKEAEKKECSNCKGGKCDKPGGKPGQQQAQSKPGQSKSSKGGSSSNANGKALVKEFENLPTSPWSRLRERSRDPANNAIKEKLPARYREVVERYMKALNDEE